MPFGGPLTYESPAAFIKEWGHHLPRQRKWGWKDGHHVHIDETDDEYEARIDQIANKLLARQTDIDASWELGMPIKVRLSDVEELTNYEFMPGDHGG